MPEPIEHPAADLAPAAPAPDTPPADSAGAEGVAGASTGNTFDALLVAKLKDAEAHLERQQAWDVTPQVFLWQPPELIGLRIPDSLWRRADGHPAGVLAHLAAAWDDIWAILHQEDPVMFSCPPSGVALLSEGWALDLSAVADDPDKTAEYYRANDARRVHAHPDRIEVRSFLAVDADLRHVFISRMRGHEPVTSFDAGEGLVLDAMKGFVSHIVVRCPIQNARPREDADTSDAVADVS